MYSKGPCLGDILCTTIQFFFLIGIYITELSINRQKICSEIRTSRTNAPSNQ